MRLREVKWLGQGFTVVALMEVRFEPETLWYHAYIYHGASHKWVKRTLRNHRICPPVRGGKLCASVQSGDGLSTGSGPAEAAQPLAGPSRFPQWPWPRWACYHAQFSLLWLLAFALNIEVLLCWVLIHLHCYVFLDWPLNYYILSFLVSCNSLFLKI